MLRNIFIKLKESIEEHSKDLKGGRAFLPAYLEDKRLTKKIFPKIARLLATKLKLQLEEEEQNCMPEIYNLNPQRVDFAFKKNGENLIFLELESISRAQLCIFRDYKGLNEDDNDNKLRYYKGTLEKGIIKNQSMPKYFIFLLILPNHKVNPYQIWDSGKTYYEFFHPSLNELIYENPCRFYDHLIKTSARLFSKQTVENSGKKIEELQNRCELVFITCTIDKLILSRGKDLFDPKKEIVKTIRWSKKR